MDEKEKINLVFSGVRVNYGSDRPIKRVNIFVAPPDIFFGVSKLNEWFIVDNTIYYEVGYFLRMMYMSDTEAFKILLMEVDFLDLTFEKFYNSYDIKKSIQFKKCLLNFSLKESVSVGVNANQYNIVRYEIHEMIEFLSMYSIFSGEDKSKLCISINKGIYDNKRMNKEIESVKESIKLIKPQKLEKEFFNKSLFEIRKNYYSSWFRI